MDKTAPACHQVSVQPVKVEKLVKKTGVRLVKFVKRVVESEKCLIKFVKLIAKVEMRAVKGGLQSIKVGNRK